MEEELHVLRAEIDSIDSQILAAIGRRLELCVRIGAMKEKLGLPMMQPGRIQEVTARLMKSAEQHGVAPEFAQSLWAMIIQEACRLETLKKADVVAS